MSVIKNLKYILIILSILVFTNIFVLYGNTLYRTYTIEKFEDDIATLAPVSAANGVPIQQLNPAYEGGEFKNLVNDPVLYSKNMLISQQHSRKYLLSLLSKIEDDAKEAKENASLAVAEATAANAYAASNLISVDPAVIAKATVQVALKGVTLAMAIDKMEKAKAAHDKASDNIAKVRQQFSMVSEAERLNKEFLPYSVKAEAAKKKQCYLI